MSDPARAKELMEQAFLRCEHEQAMCSGCALQAALAYAAERTAALRAALKDHAAWCSTCAALLAAPDRAAEEWRALTELREASEELARDMAGDVMYDAETEPAIYPLSGAIVERFRAAVERSRQ